MKVHTFGCFWLFGFWHSAQLQPLESVNWLTACFVHGSNKTAQSELNASALLNSLEVASCSALLLFESTCAIRHRPPHQPTTAWNNHHHRTEHCLTDAQSEAYRWTCAKQGETASVVWNRLFRFPSEIMGSWLFCFVRFDGGNFIRPFIRVFEEKFRNLRRIHLFASFLNRNQSQLKATTDKSTKRLASFLGKHEIYWLFCWHGASVGPNRLVIPGEHLFASNALFCAR